MAQSAHKTNFPTKIGGEEMERVARADADKPVVPVPPVVKPVEIELAVRLVAIHDDHIRVAVGVKPYTRSAVCSIVR